MKYRLTFLTAIMAVALSGTARAQGIGMRLGGGPAYAGSFGVTGLFALELHAPKIFARADVRGLLTGDDAQAVYGGGGIGVQLVQRRLVRHYAMITVARGLDVREADYTTTAGIALGGESVRRAGVFGELRVEHQWQEDFPYYRLPRNQVTLTGGLRLGGR